MKDELEYQIVDESSEYKKQLTELFNIKNFPIETLPICWAIVYT
jgi:hypothetical protein